jgi:hypothetical protein
MTYQPDDLIAGLERACDLLRERPVGECGGRQLSDNDFHHIMLTVHRAWKFLWQH